ncbi:hypothetical protein OE88DRAFT_371947 [Heliocybe sulcata]|uniref:C2H2-type domain-containing protein n=1 Tax=Heliocybe sulcata TaxID=5364 RepID=A0A5C3MX08_9AGAM|nr:hypothetical protein OE88DRAFT_371947 [Heliocybe sulcata]
MKLEDDDSTSSHRFAASMQQQVVDFTTASSKPVGYDTDYLHPDPTAWAGGTEVSRSSSCSSVSWESRSYHERTSPYPSPMTSATSLVDSSLSKPEAWTYPRVQPEDKGMIKQEVGTSAIKRASRARRKNPAKWLCQICGSTFTRRNNLKGRETSHKGERPYLCFSPRCEKSFARPSDLKRHTKAVHKNQQEGRM